MKITRRQLRKQLRRIIREERIRFLFEQEAEGSKDDEKGEESSDDAAFQTLVDSVQDAAEVAVDAGLSKEEIAMTIQGMIDDMA